MYELSWAHAQRIEGSNFDDRDVVWKSVGPESKKAHDERGKIKTPYREGRLSAVLGEGTWHELLFIVALN